MLIGNGCKPDDVLIAEILMVSGCMNKKTQKMSVTKRFARNFSYNNFGQVALENKAAHLLQIWAGVITLQLLLKIGQLAQITFIISDQNNIVWCVYVCMCALCGVCMCICVYACCLCFAYISFCLRVFCIHLCYQTHGFAYICVTITHGFVYICDTITHG